MEVDISCPIKPLVDEGYWRKGIGVKNDLKNQIAFMHGPQVKILKMIKSKETRKTLKRQKVQRYVL